MMPASYDAVGSRWASSMDAGQLGSFDYNLLTGEFARDERLSRMFGFVGDETFDRSIGAFNRRVHPDDLRLFTQAMAEAAETGGKLQTVYRVLLPDGQTRWMEVRGRAMTGVDGRTERLVGVMLDVTEQQQGVKRADVVLESMSVGFVSLDGQWRVTYVNAEAEALTGRSRSELVGGDLFELFADSLSRPLEAAYRRVAETRVTETVEGFSPPPVNRWLEVRIVPNLDGDGISLYFVDFAQRRAAQELLQLAIEFGEQLVGAVEVDEAVAAMARSVIPRLADWAIVSLRDHDGVLRDVRCAHVDPTMQPVLEQYMTTRRDGGGNVVADQALLSGQPVVLDRAVREIALNMAGSPVTKAAIVLLATESVVHVPLNSDGTATGVLTLGRAADREAMDERELATTVAMCRRAGMAIDNARLSAEQNRAAEHDRTVAQTLQSVLQSELPQSADLTVAGAYLAATEHDEVGGDWFDAFVQPGGALTVIIGDVVGHDIAAAATMGQLRAMLRMTAWDRDESPARIVSRLDQANFNLRLHAMATMAVGRIEQSSADKLRGVRTLRWTNAGHPPPILLLADGTTEALTGDRNDVFIGVLPDAERHDHTHELPPGFTLLLYTDGLVETRTASINDGIERLRETLTRDHRLAPAELLNALLAELVGEHPSDDTAIMIVRADQGLPAAAP